MANKKYTEEHINYLREIAPGRHNDEITKMFNKKFGMNATESAVGSLKTKNKIRSNVPTTKTGYTKEQIDYLRELCEKGLFIKEITEEFNKKFGTNRSEKAISNQKQKYKLHTSARNFWQKGHIPWNKNKTGYMGANKTSFKKGNVTARRRPVGSERINIDGYTEVKVAEPNKWKYKHIVIWEKHNGPLPEGCCVIFGDGDNKNLDIDNLICVSRLQLLKLNQNGLIKNNANLTRIGIAIADLQIKIGEVSKNIKKGSENSTAES